MRPLLEVSKGRLLGHPIHTMLVHFPIALFPFSFVLQLISFQNQNAHLALFALYCIIGGVALAFFSAIFGALDLLRIKPNSEAMKKGLIHAGINLSIVTGYIIIIALDFKNYPNIPVPSIMILIVNGIFVIGLIVAAYFGGDMIYTDKVGIITDKEGHKHRTSE